ncbi:AMP-binding protein [Kutzneria kofuensis]|uniref:Amino acid adenylation domain-containing protein n=1 Tax=Kutzneria kofuensis TaxID=103725 RepID=A0A7W9KC45_9PSEU|nr:AMP-binding protein [Kutzneria kofuensis]MBB5889904.1 amino acid adenylation domain-containing protein [Kutzneria kofuensis]
MRLPDLLSGAFARHTDRVALRCADQEWTYAALDRVTGALAARIGRECPAGRRVLVVGEHTAEAVVWALAALRSHAVYTPTNPGLPAERLAESARVAGAGLAVCFDDEGVAKAAAAGVPALDTRRIDLDEAGEQATPACDSPIAYSIFTSGSTGRPKLVDVGHGGLLNLCRSLRRLLDIRPGEEVLQFASLSFDASITEIVAALHAGATVAVPAREQHSWLGAVSRHLAEHGADLIMVPPSVYARLGDQAQRRVRKVQFAGEALGKAEFETAVRHSLVFNAYGPTEATVCFSMAAMTEFGATIGTPIDGFTALVRDPETGDLADSGVGELVIVGDGVALGYVGGDPDEQRRFSEVEGRRAYRTGDRVALDRAGLTYMGRVDEQIKRLGHRVNLAHVESALAVHLCVPVAMVQLGDELVLATTTARGGVDAVMARLRQLLPAWEVPDRVAVVPDFPLATSGKLDKGALGDLLSADTEAPAAAAGGTELRRVLDVVTEVLGAEVAPEGSIFDAGASSLAMMRIQVKLTEVYGQQAVEAAFDAMDYDFVPTDFLKHVRGEEVTREASATELAYRQATAELAELRAELPLLRRAAPAGPGLVLVTGASGFIGGHVLERLLAEGRRALVVSTGTAQRLRTAHAARFGRPSAELDEVEVIDYPELARRVEQGSGPAVDAVVHCGYEVNHLLPLDRHMNANARTTALVARAAAAFGARSFAFLSAASAGERFTDLSAEALAAVGDPYSRSKLVCEAYVETLATIGCQVASYRAGLVYGHGPADTAFLRQDWFSALLNLSARLRAMPRLDGLVPICDVQLVVDALLAGLHRAPARSQVVVHRTYGLDDLLATAGLTADDVVDITEWFDLARDSGADPRVLAATQAALGGRGWREARRETDRELLADLLALLGAATAVGV